MHFKKRPRRLSPVAPMCTVAVRPSGIHGLGVFATVNIAAQQFIGAYEGRRYAPRTPRPDWDGEMTYLFLLSDGSLIDGAHGGNATRHINHSCSPNVEGVEDSDAKGRLMVEVRATRPIRAGEELLLDYALDIVDEDPTDYPCACGDEKCRGSLAVVVGSALGHRS